MTNFNLIADLTFDVMKVLSYGVIGLGFLLALLAYRLLVLEQKQVEPRPPILSATNKFMMFSVFLCIIGIFSEYVHSAIDPLRPELSSLKAENANLMKQKEALEQKLAAMPTGKQAKSDPMVYSAEDIEFAKTLERFANYIAIYKYINKLLVV